MGKENMQEALSGNTLEPHGLCHISEVLDHILSNIDLLMKVYEDKH